MLTVTKKTGFICSSGKVKILDERGFPFYYFDFTGKTNKCFNLPKGNFMVIEGDIKPIKKPLKYKVKKLPTPDYFGRENPKNFKLIVKENPNKASIDFFRKIIVIDPSYKRKPRLIVDYIFAHESGHRFYSNQKFADHYAKQYLLKIGYNPSQLIIAPDLALSDKAENRKNYLLNV